MRFIVDHNVGKLVKWLRMMGHDTAFFTGDDDWEMVKAALEEDRVILTRDSGIMSRGVIAAGPVKAILIESDQPEEQIRQVVRAFGLDVSSGLFSVCLECNRPLEERTREQVRDRVPPYVYRTQDRYFECPACHRIYWKGTHWRAMMEKVDKLKGSRR
jgi:uncharacterized protein with PIN domain